MPRTQELTGLSNNKRLRIIEDDTNLRGTVEWQEGVLGETGIDIVQYGVLILPNKHLLMNKLS